MKDIFRIICDVVAIGLVAVGSYQGWMGNYDVGTFFLVSALILTIHN